jgi:hypothetical protein
MIDDKGEHLPGSSSPKESPFSLLSATGVLKPSDDKAKRDSLVTTKLARKTFNKDPIAQTKKYL